MPVSTNWSRRKLLRSGSGLLLGSGLWPLSTAIAQQLARPENVAPDQLAQDEDFWSLVASYYDRGEGVVNLEHGYWGKMARPVQEYYLETTAMVNRELSYYARRSYGADVSRSVAAVADSLGVAPDEIALTRNASEAIQNLIRQYRDFQPGDRVLYADIDYPAFKNLITWLDQGRGVEVVKLSLPARCDSSTALNAYRNAMAANPQLKMMLLTHVSNQHGLRLPVAEIAAEARARGIDVVCDAAQSWGLVDFRLPELGVDWAGFNLHKWIGAPVGVGALYMRRGTLAKVAPFPGDADPDESRVAARVHTATSNFAAFLSVEPALQFHHGLGGAFKEARLTYLASLWREPAQTLPGVEVLGPTDAASATGMGGFRLRGQNSVAQVQELQRTLEQRFGIFTVARYGLDSGACIRVTPQVFNTPADMTQLTSALEQLTA